MTNLERNQSENALDNAQFFGAPEAMFISPKKKAYPENDTKAFLREGLENFAKSLNEVLVDITALEINTMLVSEIKGYKFVAEEAYQDIYFCLNSDRKIPKSLNDQLLEELEGVFEEKRIPHKFRYSREEIFSDKNDSSDKAELKRERARKNWKLREKLTQAYRQIFSEQISHKLPESSPHLGSKLPFPYDISGDNALGNLYLNPVLRQDILQNSQFLRSLRKLKELKAGIDTDSTIYAQTIIQLDGDIINRYSQDLFNGENKDLERDLLIELHNRSVIAGEEQWRGLLGFCVNILRDLVSSRHNGV